MAPKAEISLGQYLKIREWVESKDGRALGKLGQGTERFNVGGKLITVVKNSVNIRPSTPDFDLILECGDQHASELEEVGIVTFTKAEQKK